MGAKLRTWLGSWRLWVTVICLVYIGLGHRLEPVIAAWPGAVAVAMGLALLAVFVVGSMVLMYGLGPYVIDPCYTYLTFTGQTAKAKEKYADSLMSLSTAVQSATLIGVLVFPLTMFIQTVASGTNPAAALVAWWQSARGWMRSTWWPGWPPVVFLILYGLPLIISVRGRRRALVIYDAIAPPAPAVAPTAPGSPEQPTFPDPGPPVYVRPHEGSRRRRRHRPK